MTPKRSAIPQQLENSGEYQLAHRIMRAWEAHPVDDASGFGEKVILARAYLAAIEAVPSLDGASDASSSPPS